MNEGLLVVIQILTFLFGAIIFSSLNKVITITKVKIFNVIVGGALALLLAVKYGYNFQLITVFSFFLLLTAVTYIDVTTMKIPNSLVLLILVVAGFSLLAFPEITIRQRIMGFFVVSTILLIITLLVPGSFGGGDIKLMAACGAFLGGKLCLIAFIMALFLGGGYGVALLIRKKIKKKEGFALGPFLAAGCMISFLYGEEIFSWFLRL